LAREVRGMTGEAQQSLHLARPVFLLAVFLLDFDERFQLAEMMRIAQRVKNAGHRVVGLPVVVHDNPGDAGE
jgi:hypothetical protein